MSLLEMETVRGGYGDMDILHGVNLRIDPGEVVAVVGPNGAGKSTAMKALFGLVQVRRGEIRFDGKDITRVPTDRIVRLCICYVPQTDNVFPSLTVEENLRTAAFLYRDDEDYVRTKMQEVLDFFPVLAERLHQPAGNLSGGEQQMVALGQANATDVIVPVVGLIRGGGYTGWQESLRFMEANLTGVGGIHFSPVAEELMLRDVVPTLPPGEPGLFMA
jgi:ABC-type branched-subunit amino acid transport system ATPase component